MKKKHSSQFQIALLILTIAAIPLTLFTLGTQQETRQHAGSEAEFEIASSVPAAKPGEPLLLSIAIESKTDPISAISLNLTYPSEKVDLVKVDTQNSAFPLSEEQITGNGIAKIGRGAEIPQAGKNHIANILFLTKKEIDASEIVVQPNSSARTYENKTMIVSSRLVANSFPPPSSNPVIQFFQSLQSKNIELWETFLSFFTK